MRSSGRTSAPYGARKVPGGTLSAAHGGSMSSSASAASGGGGSGMSGGGGSGSSAGLKRYFSQFGAVESAQVMYNRDTAKSRGFGFVIFAEESAVDRAIAAGLYHTLDDKEVEIKRAVPKASAFQVAPTPPTASAPSIGSSGAMTAGAGSSTRSSTTLSSPDAAVASRAAPLVVGGSSSHSGGASAGVKLVGSGPAATPQGASSALGPAAAKPPGVPAWGPHARAIIAGTPSAVAPAPVVSAATAAPSPATPSNGSGAGTVSVGRAPVASGTKVAAVPPTASVIVPVAPAKPSGAQASVHGPAAKQQAPAAPTPVPAPTVDASVATQSSAVTPPKPTHGVAPVQVPSSTASHQSTSRQTSSWASAAARASVTAHVATTLPSASDEGGVPLPEGSATPTAAACGLSLHLSNTSSEGAHNSSRSGSSSVSSPASTVPLPCARTSGSAPLPPVAPSSGQRGGVATPAVAASSGQPIDRVNGDPSLSSNKASSSTTQPVYLLTPIGTPGLAGSIASTLGSVGSQRKVSESSLTTAASTPSFTSQMAPDLLGQSSFGGIGLGLGAGFCSLAEELRDHVLVSGNSLPGGASTNGVAPSAEHRPSHDQYLNLASAASFFGVSSASAAPSVTSESAPSVRSGEGSGTLLSSLLDTSYGMSLPSRNTGSGAVPAPDIMSMFHSASLHDGGWSSPIDVGGLAIHMDRDASAGMTSGSKALPAASAPPADSTAASVLAASLLGSIGNDELMFGLMQSLPHTSSDVLLGADKSTDTLARQHMGMLPGAMPMLPDGSSIRTFAAQVSRAPAGVSSAGVASAQAGMGMGGGGMHMSRVAGMPPAQHGGAHFPSSFTGTHDAAPPGMRVGAGALPGSTSYVRAGLGPQPGFAHGSPVPTQRMGPMMVTSGPMRSVPAPSVGSSGMPTSYGFDAVGGPSAALSTDAATAAATVAAGRMWMPSHSAGASPTLHLPHPASGHAGVQHAPPLHVGAPEPSMYALAAAAAAMAAGGYPASMMPPGHAQFGAPQAMSYPSFRGVGGAPGMHSGSHFGAAPGRSMQPVMPSIGHLPSAAPAAASSQWREGAA